ncbi:hypothetical protein SRB17_42420 [Streptomyces sp. RB17]|nr:hypothetical protein [Streptomyces sp. RB17]
MSCLLWGRRWNSLADAGVSKVGKASVKPVTAGTPPVHVHLLLHLHVNGVMIRVS